MNKLKFSVIWKISLFTNATNKFWSLVVNGSVDVGEFKIFIQVIVWLGFRPFFYWVKSICYASFTIHYY